MIQVLLVDDHAVIRAGLHRLLDDMPGISVVAEASSGREALECVAHTSPDVVIMDISMADMNGIEATERLRTLRPTVHILVLSAHSSADIVHQAFKAGATGYILKAVRPDELEHAIRAVASGETYLCRDISKTVVSGYMNKPAGAKGPLIVLTPRQREILQLVAEGLSSREIAAKLGVSVKTIESHRLQMMERLGIHDVAGLVRFAVQSGVIHID